MHFNSLSGYLAQSVLNDFYMYGLYVAATGGLFFELFKDVFSVFQGTGPRIWVSSENYSRNELFLQIKCEDKY